MQNYSQTAVRIFFILLIVILVPITGPNKSVADMSQSTLVGSAFCGLQKSTGADENVEDEKLAKFYCNSANLMFEEYRTCRGEGRDLLNEDAKELYTLAAQYGSLDAHYLLTYQYTPESRESEIAHLQFAASRGHLEALKSLSETLIFRCDSLDYFDPQLVLETFDEALQYHPSLKEEVATFDIASSYDEYQLPGRYALIEMCCELLRGLEPFDVQAFRDTYGITKEEENEVYGIWLLAEQASIEGGRFGVLNQNLVYHLVLRGGWAPMEYVGALQKMHAAWKTGEAFTFDICTYMTSSVAANICASRSTKRSVETYQANIESIAESVQGALKDKVIKVSKAYLEFVDHKVYNEERQYGTWKYYWVARSLNRQLERFVELLQSVLQKKYELEVSVGYEKIEREFNAVYKHYIIESKENEYPEEESISTSHRLWIVYRDSAAECLSALDPRISIVEWKTVFTKTRIRQLQWGELK